MSKKNNSKEIGNTFERKIAKELSIWIFNDPHVLKKEPTSGAVKTVYWGDIFPMKQIEWDHFPFLIECKYGYEDFTPTLLNYRLIEEWYKKAYKESLESKVQEIILLIRNFKGRNGVLLCTNKILSNIIYKSIICINNDNKYELVYCYNYKDMLKYKFEDVFCG